MGGVFILLAGTTASAVALSRTPDAAAYLTFAGAVLVALITWYATDRRQKTALVAEDSHLSQQLAHARRLDDRQELRKFIDSVAETFDDLHRAYTQCMVYLGDGATTEEPRRTQLRELHKTARKRVADGMLDLRRLAMRLELRFPRSHELPVAVRKALGELNAGIEILEQERDPLDRVSRASSRGQAALDAFKAFTDASRQVFDVGDATPSKEAE